MKKDNIHPASSDSTLDSELDTPVIDHSHLSSPSPWWERLLSFFGQLIIFLGLLFLFVIGIGFLLELTPLSHTRTMIGDLLYEWSIPFIAGLLAIYFMDFIQQKKGMTAYGFSNNAVAKSLFTGLWVGSSILLFSFFILIIGGWATVSNFDFQTGLFFSWLLFFLIQPLTEEIVMRSFLQTQLHRYFGRQTGLIMTALAFSLMHGANDHITIIAFIQIFLGGYLIGLLFLHTSNIWASFAMHACWNFLQSIVLGFSVSGMATYRIIETTTAGPDWLTGGNFGLEGSLLTLIFLIIGIVYFWNANKI